MYVSHQALRILAGDGMTTAQQREADDQLGRIIAALSRSGRRFGERNAGAGSSRAQVGKLSKSRSVSLATRGEGGE